MQGELDLLFPASLGAWRGRKNTGEEVFKGGEDGPSGGWAESGRLGSTPTVMLDLNLHSWVARAVFGCSGLLRSRPPPGVAKNWVYLLRLLAALAQEKAKASPFL